MNWFKAGDPKRPLSSSSKHPFQHALDNIQTNFSNIMRIPNFRIPNPFSRNLARPKEEIMKHMSTVPIYALTCATSLQEVYVRCPKTRKEIDLRYFSKTDADDFLRDQYHGVLFQTRSLATVVESEGDDKVPPTRLVPEINQVKNALQQLKKKDGVAFSEDTFSGVPIFQSDELRVRFESNTNEWRLTSSKDEKHELYRPAYLRKEDLEIAIATQLGWQYKGTIQVTSLEDIIKEMKDGSTLKSNDVIFMAPDRVG